MDTPRVIATGAWWGHGDPVTARLGLGEGAGIPVRRTPLRATPPGLEWTGEGGFGGPRLHPAPRTSRWGPRGAGSRRGRGTPCAPACKAPCASPPAPQGRALALERTLTGSKLGWGGSPGRTEPRCRPLAVEPAWDRQRARGGVDVPTRRVSGDPVGVTSFPHPRLGARARAHSRPEGAAGRTGQARPGQASPGPALGVGLGDFGLQLGGPPGWLPARTEHPLWGLPLPPHPVLPIKGVGGPGGRPELCRNLARVLELLKFQATFARPGCASLPARKEGPRRL